MTLVRNQDEVIRNIKTYNEELPFSDELQERMSLNRAWYGYEDKDLGWLFGPSKFIGYSGMNAADYINRDIPLDGRQTESRLQDWFVVIDTGADSNEAIWIQLTDLLSKYGKSPSKLARLNVLVSADAAGNDDIHAATSALILKVVSQMPIGARQALISELKSLA